MSESINPKCAQCPTGACYPLIKTDKIPSLDKAPNFCPMKNMQDTLGKAASEYNKPDVKEFARQASIQEFECYECQPDGMKRPAIPRIMELIEFSRKCGYKRLGLAFCGGLKNEARILTEILQNKGFEVVSVRCKVGALPKEKIGVKPEEKIHGPENWETMCNPITQAEIMNAANVDLAIMLGLCIGHDTLFLKYCRRPVTVIAVKDRVTGHNPLAVLYTSSSYYSSLTTKD